MDHELEPIAELGRVSTGIPGLDTLLRGGLIEGGVYLLLGQPGTGKTILSNHVAFSHVRAGGRVVYTTVLSETHARMLSNLRPFEFFDQSVVGDAVFYVSGYQALEREGLAGLLRLLRQMVRERRASLLVVDGIVTALAFPTPEIELKRFVHELKTFAETVGCTVLILSSLPSLGTHYPAQTMVDGIVCLTEDHVGMRRVRKIEIVKLRGSDSVSGAHFYEISAEGFAVHPRVEALYPPAAALEERSQRAIETGIRGLDELLGEGARSGSATLIFGPPGSGKTLSGLQFLAQGAASGELGTFVGFHESERRLVDKARGIGLDLRPQLRAGRLELLWQPALEVVADALVERVLDSVRRRGVRRVVVDGVEDLARNIAYPERVTKVLGALVQQLRSRDVTCILTREAPGLGRELRDLPLDGLTAMADNLVVLRYVEKARTIVRLVSVLKTREGAHGAPTREFTISADGIVVGGSSRRRPSTRAKLEAAVKAGPAARPTSRRRR